MNAHCSWTPKIRISSWLIALGLLVLAPTAQALTTLCVSNSTELRSALLNNASDTLDIRVRSGVYLAGGQQFPFRALDRIATLSGGWSGAAGQCTTQSQNPAATLLDAQGSSSALQMEPVVGATSGALFLSNLSLTGGSSDFGGCLFVDFRQGSFTVVIDRIIVSGCQGSNLFGSAGGAYIRNWSASNITLRNSLISNNQGHTAGGVTVNSDHVDARTFLTNNTIVANASTFAPGAGGFSPPTQEATVGIITLRNNAIVGNQAFGNPVDLSFGQGPASSHVLRNNAVQVINGAANTNSQGTLVTSAPGFVGGGQYQLGSQSPLRNAGISLTVGEAGARDLDFGVRVQGGAIDIGAYEFDGLFGSGFE
ncbi:MAG: hypothetical protein KDI48_17640 [Xanthomonadales bacterium]|nr:hypothetical protein [Xanthomonadales bacterium]